MAFNLIEKSLFAFVFFWKCAEEMMIRLNGISVTCDLFPSLLSTLIDSDNSPSLSITVFTPNDQKGETQEREWSCGVKTTNNL